MRCRICNNDKNLETFEVREMMFGLREVFSYFQCPVCSCLQISDIPQDMSKYYPPEYYSFNMSAGKEGMLKSLLKRSRDRFTVTGNGFLGRILNLIFPADIIKIYSGIPLNSNILDAGCGTGALIYRLKEAGFTNLLGIDPYNDDLITYSNGLQVEKKSLREIDGSWDIITYHHSFEHIGEPLDELGKVRELLSEDGICIIRIPIVDSYAWQHYRSNWIQLDAPRHFFLYSVKSLEMLAWKAGLRVDKVEYDSTAFQFWGSEQYRKDISLYDGKSYQVNQGKSIFSKGEIKVYERLAEKLNRDGKGDQAVFFMKRKK